jgi:hypothetical protein
MKRTQFIYLLSLVITISGCVQQSHQKFVKVTLDMRNIENPKDVGIRGQSPLSWEETTYLEDPDGDGIFEGEFEFYTTVSQIEFKFVNQNDDFELEGQPNRSIAFEYKPEKMTYSAVFDEPDGELTKY